LFPVALSPQNNPSFDDPQNTLSCGSAEADNTSAWSLLWYSIYERFTRSQEIDIISIGVLADNLKLIVD